MRDSVLPTKLPNNMKGKLAHLMISKKHQLGLAQWFFSKKTGHTLRDVQVISNNHHYRVKLFSGHSQEPPSQGFLFSLPAGANTVAN